MKSILKAKLRIILSPLQLNVKGHFMKYTLMIRKTPTIIWRKIQPSGFENKFIKHQYNFIKSPYMIMHSKKGYHLSATFFTKMKPYLEQVFSFINLI